MARVQFTSGTIAGSALVSVAAPAANGTLVLVHSGNAELGRATLSAGVATLTLTRQLVAGEVLLASLSEVGQGCGLPVVIAETGIVINGWRTPTEISVTNALTGETLLLTAAQFAELYGYASPSIQDPAGLEPRLWPEYTPGPVEQLQFDLLTDRSAGQTVVTVTNVLNARGGILVSWNGAGYANVLTQTYTSAQSIVVRVKGSGNAEVEAAERALAITIQPAPPAGSGAGSNPDARLGGVIWRDFSNNYVRVEINADAAVQVRLSGAGAWQDCISYAPQYWEAPFTGIGSGVYNAQLRISGETDSSKWKLWSFTKQ